jgi:predicted HD phosphohydrolase
MRQTGLSGDNLRAFALLHELGHAAGIYEDDRYSTEAQRRNNNKVLKGCFPGHEIAEPREIKRGR